MKIIINAEPDEMTYVMGLVTEAFATFARHPDRIGWGWTFGTPGRRSFFISRTKGGFSARPAGEGAIAFVSTRTEKDLPVTVSIELNNIGSMRSREEGAALTAGLEAALGVETATRLAQDGAVPVAAPDAAAADAMMNAITALGEKHAHAIHLNAWRT